MCLTRIGFFEVKKNTGWKALIRSWNKKLLFAGICPGTKTTRITSKCFATAYGLHIDFEEDKGSYPAGFHVFLKRQDAHEWAKNSFGDLVIKNVKFRKIVAKGYQGSAEVVVVKEVKLEAVR